MAEKIIVGIIYKITNLLNGMIYIGQTIRSLEKRFQEHKRNDTFLGMAIREFGAENFKPEILEECSSFQQLNERERFWIKELNSLYPNGYNLTKGGESNFGYKLKECLDKPIDINYFPELWVLRYFLEVARTGEVKAAADNLYTDLSGMSKQIKILESKLGKKLLQRYRGKFEPTKEGLFIKQYAEKIFAIVDETIDKFKPPNGVRFRLDIKTLKIFLEIVRIGRIGVAAKIFDLNRSALSQRMTLLEFELDKKLICRKSSGIVLTEQGILFKPYAEAIVGLFDEMAREFKMLFNSIEGDIKIGCAEADGFKHFVRILTALQKKYPRVRCHLYSSDSASTTDKLDRGFLDFAIIAHGNINLKKYNYATLPTENRWGLIMRRDCELAAKAEILREDLLGIPLICSRQGLDEELLSWLGKIHDKLKIVATYDLIFNASIMAREGFGYLLGYDKIIFTGGSSELCFRPLSPPQVSPMHIIWKKNHALTPLARALKDFLEEVPK